MVAQVSNPPKLAYYIKPGWAVLFPNLQLSCTVVGLQVHGKL